MSSKMLLTSLRGTGKTLLIQVTPGVVLGWVANVQVMRVGG